MVVVECRPRDKVCRNLRDKKRLVDDHGPAAEELDKEQGHTGDLNMSLSLGSNDFVLGIVLSYPIR